jgi:hypothetical protein
MEEPHQATARRIQVMQNQKKQKKSKN